MWLGLSAFVVLAIAAAFVVASMRFGDGPGSVDESDDPHDRR